MPSRSALAVLCLLVALATVAWRVLTFSGFNNDHYIYLAGAQQMVLGEWPVRDFVDPGWPLMNALSAAARAIFGRALLVELLLVACALAIGAMCTLSAAARLSGSLTLGVAAAVLEILANPRSFGYPKVLLYGIAVWAFVRYAASPTRRGILLLAGLSAIAFLFRHDHGIYVGVGAFVAVVASGTRLPRASLRTAVLFPVAVVALLLPWAIYVQYEVGFADYLRPALAFSRAEADATLMRSLPVLDTTVPLLGRDNSGVLLFYLFHALPLVCAVLAGVRWRRGSERWEGESAAIIAIALMAVPMNLGFMRTPLLARVPDAIVPAFVLLAWLLGLAFEARGWLRRGAAFATASAALVFVGMAVTSMADLPGELNRIGVVNRRGAFVRRIADLEKRLPRAMPEGNQIPSRNSEALLPFYDYVERCSAPADRIVMTGLSPDVFVLANRGFAGGQMAFRPNFYASEADQRRAIARMQRQSVPFFVLALEEEPDFRRALPLVSQYLDTHYEPLVDFAVPSTRGLRVYVERGRRAPSADGATGWPCFTVRPEIAAAR
jgi:hypothetical protein